MDFQGADKHVCGQVCVGLNLGGVQRIGVVEVAGQRAQRERGGRAVSEKEVEGTQGDWSCPAPVGKMPQQPVHRFQRWPDVCVVEVGEPLSVLAALNVHQTQQLGAFR